MVDLTIYTSQDEWRRKGVEYDKAENDILEKDANKLNTEFVVNKKQANIVSQIANSGIDLDYGRAMYPLFRKKSKLIKKSVKRKPKKIVKKCKCK